MADNVVPFPRDVDEFDPTEYIRQEQQAQARNVITSIDADPDQAARAQSLSQSTGVPAAVIYGDQENFEKQHKIALTNSILSNNQYLRDYMDSNPMAAKVSNDDVGQLDTISQALQKYGVAGALHKAAMSGPFGGDVATKTAEGFIEGWGDSTFGTWAFNMPGSEKVWWASKALYNIIGIPIEGGARAFTGAVYGAYRGGTELFKQFGMDEQTADRMARDLIGMAEHHIISGQAHMPEIAPELIDKIQAKRLMSYITKGEEPPIGISPMYDTLKIEEAKKDLGDLKEITKEAHASSTRERSPELFGDFIRQHTGNTKISIDASAVRQLYGDKPPELEDGLLGWVPGIKDQLGVAEATGGYIEVPLADWLARVEPEVANQLHDFIRVKPNGMSLEETKFQKEYQSVIDEMVEAFHGTGKDFDTFDTGHIGSGQGAQSYGYGHYLAQERKVAEQYQEQMSRHARAGHDLANSYAFEYEGNKELALQKLERDRTKSKGEKAPWYPDEVYQAAIDALKSGKDLSRPTGNLLKVRINREPHEFLDWDNALPLDHPARAAAVKALEPDTLGKKLSEALEIGLEGGTLRPMARDMILTNKELTGMDLYNQLARRLAKGKGFDDKGASKVLSEAGIAGIKYLDQQSRGKTNSAWWQDNIAHLNEQLKGEEDPHKIAQIKASIGLAENALERMKETGEPTITSNFVVFNDKDLQILERNGKPLSSGDAMTDTIREQGGMHPLFDEERVNKLQLEKVQDVEEPVPSWTTAATGYGTRFDIKDLAGNTAGQLLVFDKGKTLDIGWLGSHERATLARPNVWGPRVVRDLLAQLKEQFPEAETITARRVSGAREVPTEVKINLEAPDEAILRKLAEELDSLFTKKQGDINVTKFPEEALTKSEKELIERVNDLLDKIAPQAEREAVQKMGKEGFVTRGRHTFDPAIASSLIQWSIESPHPLGTARHEAIHHLRTMGMFKPEEWISLEEASRRGDWQERFRIEERYPDQTQEVRIEESIAEAYREWGAGRLEVEGPIAKLFERIKELLKQIAEIYREYTGQLPDAQRLFEKIEKGEIGQREAFSGEMPTRVKEAYGLSEEEPTTKMKQTELPQAGTTRIEDRGIFQKGQAIGMTEKQYRRYQELIEKQWKEDIESHLAKYERKERIRQTKEWKENTAEMRKEVEQDTLGRPDVGADEFFRKGMLYGERVPGKIPKIDSSKLTEEQRAAIPEKYQSKEGLTPDDVAGLFGYQSGDALIRELGNYETARKESGLEGKAFLDSMIDKLTDQRMEEKYGKLKENIIADAKDQALSQTQLDLIHEEVLALAAKNKAEISLTKDQMVQWLQTEFNKLPVGYVRSDAFLRSANRYGKLAEMGLLKGDFAEAFKAKQGQFNAVFMAKAAAKFEKERESFERQAEFMSKREVPTVDQEYTDWVHDILDRTGQKVKRTRDDLDASIASRSNKTLQDFVEYKTFHDMRELPVSDLILDPKFKKPFDSLSVDEFRQVKDAIKTLVHNGREEMKIYKQGQAADLAVIKTGLIDQLRTFPARYRGTDQGRKLTASRLLNSVLASHLQMEALFNRWDRGDPNGLWTQYVMRDLSTAANEEAILEKSFSRMLKAIGEPKNLNGKLENNLFLDPLMKDAGSSLPMEMTRRNLLAVMLNMG
ncbi:MAG TPA: hypothetical protein VLG09_04335, partial [Candidatus Saccharimonadales bacterium]|nr:hypothetical protein [Candidatus Saccharimonadales bacterium]